jgi:hypothetical protein
MPSHPDRVRANYAQSSRPCRGGSLTRGKSDECAICQDGPCVYERAVDAWFCSVVCRIIWLQGKDASGAQA